MNATLRQIRSFVVLAASASFTRAAAVLHISQPALTVQIRQLEEALGVQLFDRNTRSVRLTRVGRELLPKLERVQDELGAVLADTKEVAAGRRGVVRLACMTSFAASGLPAAIAAFRREHPQIGFTIRDAVWSHVIAMVRSDEVDFGIGDRVAAEPDLEFLPILEDRMHVVFTAGHPVEKMRGITLKRLSEFPMVMLDPQTSTRGLIDAAFAAAGCAPPPRACEVMFLSTAVAMVRAGLGITILPSTAIEWRAHEGLRSRAIAETAFQRQVGVFRREGRTLPPASAEFVDMLTRRWRSRAGDAGVRQR